MNTELWKCPFKAGSRSECSHARFTCCLEFLACPNFNLTGSFSYIFILYCLHFKLHQLWLMQLPLLTHGTKEVTLLIVMSDWSRFLCQVLCVCCWLCCVQSCDPAFYLWFSYSCFELVHINCESAICPEVIRCGLQDVKIQTLTNQKKHSKDKGTLHNTKPLVS